MKIAVTDACIFIDLIELKIISDFFKLDIELHTTIDVVNELYLEQQEILIAYEAGDQLVIHNLEHNQIEEIESMGFPKGLSPEDRSVIYIANILKDALILSSDKLVRNHAGSMSIEYHGILWIFDQLVSENILSKESCAFKLKELLKLNIIYSHPKTKKEIDKRVDEWE